MIDRRKHKRLDLDVSIRLEALNEEGIATSNFVHVDVTDISRSGIGFRSKERLDLDSYYDTQIQIWTKEVIDAVIELVREEQLEDGTYKYGAVFIGMSDTDAVKIDIYQIFNEK